MMDQVTRIIQYRFRNIKAFAQYFGTVRRFAPRTDLILLFHGIDRRGNQRYNLRFTSQADFLFIVNTLKRYYSLSRLEDLSSPAEKPRLVLTFDDGYKNWRTHLLPLLEEFRIPATLFITVSGNRILWTDQYDIFRSHYSFPVEIGGRKFFKLNGFYRTKEGMELNQFLKASPFETIREFQNKTKIENAILENTRMYWELLNEEDVQYLSGAEWISIGSHGCTHTSLDRLGDDQLRFELGQSRQYLFSVTGTPVKSLSFPSGKYDERVIEFSRQAGYEFYLRRISYFPLGRRMRGTYLSEKGFIQ